MVNGLESQIVDEGRIMIRRLHDYTGRAVVGGIRDGIVQQKLLANDTPQAARRRQFGLKPSGQFSCAPLRIRDICIVKSNIDQHCSVPKSDGEG
jgi:hypothetical protein